MPSDASERRGLRSVATLALVSQGSPSIAEKLTKRAAPSSMANSATTSVTSSTAPVATTMASFAGISAVRARAAIVSGMAARPGRMVMGIRRPVSMASVTRRRVGHAGVGASAISAVDPATAGLSARLGASGGEEDHHHEDQDHRQDHQFARHGNLPHVVRYSAMMTGAGACRKPPLVPGKSRSDPRARPAL